jgi:Leucine Rich repeat
MVSKRSKLPTELADYTTLKHLDLHCSNIDGDGTMVISGALTASTSLRVLRLWYTRIGGKEALARALMRATLEELSFGGNKIGDDGSVALADALETNTSLTVYFAVREVSTGCDDGRASRS